MSTYSKLIPTLFLIILSASLFSQESAKQEKIRQKEAGILFQSLNDFGITYRIGNENGLWRFNSLLLNGSQNKNDSFFDSRFPSVQNEITTSVIGVSLSIGREHRKKIHENLEVRLGNDVLLGYNYQKTETTTFPSTVIDKSSNEQYSIGVGLVFGFNYLIKDVLVIGAEVVPAVNYFENINTNNGSEFINSGVNYGFSSNSARISIVFRY